MAIFERIVTVYNDKGSKQALKDLNKLEENFAAAGKKIAKAFAVATAAAGALALKVGKDAVEAAISDQKSQVLLANALRNTTGASDAAIASVEDYIAAQQRSVSVTDDELRPSLATLVAATKDVTQAQSLQNLALDISAGTQKDLQSVSIALAKAVGGNIGALTKLGVPLSASVVKSKDLNAALGELGKTFQGAASQRAKTLEFRMKALQISFGEALETLGYALIPVLEDLANTFQTQVLPVFERFIAENKDQIASTFADLIKFALGAAKALASMFKTISDNLTTFKVFAGILTGLFIGSKVYAGIQLVISAINLLTTSFKRQAAAGTAAGTATAFATGGASAVAATAAILAFAVAAGTTYYAINKLTESVNENSAAVATNSAVVTGHISDLDNLAKKIAVINAQNKKNIVIATNLNKKTAEQIASEKALAALKKLGVKPTAEKDPIQLEAARLNLLKQANIEEANRVAEIMKNLEAQMKLNEAAQRYADLLTVLSDTIISDEEVSVLAQKWNLTKGEVLEYIARIYAANSTDITDGPIVNLLMKWGLTKDEAEKYVDFTRALKDEKIDDKEIEELMGKWGMTRAEVVAYGKTVSEGTALQRNLSKSWSMPGDEAADAWKRALKALNDYLAALQQKTTVSNATVFSADTVAAYLAGDPDVIAAVEADADAMAALAESEAAIAEGILAESEAALAAAALAALGVPVFSDSGTPSIPPSDFASGTFTNPAISNLAKRTGDFADFGMGSSSAGTVVNITVNGSVTSENDLIATVREGLLNSQGSGNSLLYSTRAV